MLRHKHRHAAFERHPELLGLERVAQHPYGGSDLVELRFQRLLPGAIGDRSDQHEHPNGIGGKRDAQIVRDRPQTLDLRVDYHHCPRPIHRFPLANHNLIGLVQIVQLRLEGPQPLLEARNLEAAKDQYLERLRGAFALSTQQPDRSPWPPESSPIVDPPRRHAHLKAERRVRIRDRRDGFRTRLGRLCQDGRPPPQRQAQQGILKRRPPPTSPAS